MNEEINLIELFNIFWKKKLFIILVTLIFVTIGVVYSFNYKVPKYKASTTVLLAQNNAQGKNEESNEITQMAITLNQNLVSTYSKLIKSKAVIKQVLQNLEMDVELEEDVRENINVEAVEDTQIIEITYIDENPRIAFEVANELLKVFCEKVREIYNMDNIYIVDKAEFDIEPYNNNYIKDILIFAIVGMGISCMIVFIKSLLDTTVKTPEDVEKNTGLIVLGQIPETRIGGKDK